MSIYIYIQVDTVTDSTIHRFETLQSARNSEFGQFLSQPFFPHCSICLRIITCIVTRINDKKCAMKSHIKNLEKI